MSSVPVYKSLREKILAAIKQSLTLSCHPAFLSKAEGKSSQPSSHPVSSLTLISSLAPESSLHQLGTRLRRSRETRSASCSRKHALFSVPLSIIAVSRIQAPRGQAERGRHGNTGVHPSPGSCLLEERWREEARADVCNETRWKNLPAKTIRRQPQITAGRLMWMFPPQHWLDQIKIKRSHWLWCSEVHWEFYLMTQFTQDFGFFFFINMGYVCLYYLKHHIKWRSTLFSLYVTVYWQ